MKIYLGIKFHEDLANKRRIEQILTILEDEGHQTACIIRDLEQWGQYRFSASELMHKTFEIIESCHLVMIDLTEKGVGVGIEAGYAYAKRVPILTIAQEGADISATLQGISQAIVRYQNCETLQDAIMPILRTFQGKESSGETPLYEQ